VIRMLCGGRGTVLLSVASELCLVRRRGPAHSKTLQRPVTTSSLHLLPAFVVDRKKGENRSAVGPGRECALGPELDEGGSEDGLVLATERHVPVIVWVDAVCCITRSMVTDKGVGGWYGKWPLDEQAPMKVSTLLALLVSPFDLAVARCNGSRWGKNTWGVTCEGRVPANEGTQPCVSFQCGTVKDAITSALCGRWFS
jgi:hypothetical protein